MPRTVPHILAVNVAGYTSLGNRALRPQLLSLRNQAPNPIPRSSIVRQGRKRRFLAYPMLCLSLFLG